MCSSKSWWPRESPIRRREWWHFGCGGLWLPGRHGSRSSTSCSVSPPSLLTEPRSRMFLTSPFSPLSLSLYKASTLFCLFVCFGWWKSTCRRLDLYSERDGKKLFLPFLSSIIWRWSYFSRVIKFWSLFNVGSWHSISLRR